MAQSALRVVFAPDSFKGSIPAGAAAAALAEGWLAARPGDEVRAIPQADGGEGTLQALARAVPGARLVGRWRTASDGPGIGPWLELPDGTAVVELAACCGFALHSPLAPLHASAFPLGATIARALDAGARRIVVALGGSASTDGGVGALSALGARFLDEFSAPIPPCGSGLTELARIDVSNLRPPPAGGVELLTDVDNPLLGPRGAARVFAPQKGATPADVELLEAALLELVQVADADLPEAKVAELAASAGVGAAGGTAFGIIALWGGRILPGATRIAAVTGLTQVIEEGAADVIVTGEGRLDATSFGGKVTGNIAAAARSSPNFGGRVWIVAGQVSPEGRQLAQAAGVEVISLSDLADGPAAAKADPHRWLTAAGRHLAARG